MINIKIFLDFVDKVGNTIHFGRHHIQRAVCLLQFCYLTRKENLLDIPDFDEIFLLFHLSDSYYRI